MSQIKVYLCPLCQTVVKSENDTPIGLVCDDCGFEFSGAGEANKSEGLSEVKIVKAVAGVGAVTNDTIVRDVMKQRSGSGQRASEREPSSVHEMVLGEGVEYEHTEIPPGEDEVVLKDGTRMVRRKKRKKEKDKHRKLYFFLTLWLGIAAAIVVIVQLNKDVDDGPSGGNGDGQIDEKAQQLIFLRKHMPEISQNFSRFIRATEDDDRIQEIDFSSLLASKFSRFHQAQSIPVPRGRLSSLARNVLVLKRDPFVPAVEVIWRDEEGQFFESVHVWDGTSWKLDWEHFARYSNVPWTLFRSKLGGKKEGEFRLLMRKRQVMRESSYFSLLFYEEPSLGVEEDQRKALQASESEEVIVKLRTDLGKQLTELFKQKENENRPYDSILGERDPNMMIRVSAILAWEEDEDGDEILVLKDLPGISWYGTRFRRAYREEQKLEEKESDDPVVPQSAVRNEPLKE